MPDFLGIAQKLEKGTALARALNGVAVREKEPWKTILRDWARSVKKEPLAAAMERCRRFGEGQVRLVALAEESGQLPAGLRMLGLLEAERNKLPRIVFRALGGVFLLFLIALLILPLPFSFLEEMGPFAYWMTVFPGLLLAGFFLWGLRWMLRQLSLPDWLPPLARRLRWGEFLELFSLSRQARILAAGLDAGLEPATLFRSARFFAPGEEIEAYASEAAEAIEQGKDPLELFLGHPSFRFEEAEDLGAVRGLLLAEAETLERSLLAFLKKRMVEPISLILFVTLMLGQARLLPFAERQAEQAEQHLEEMESSP